MRPLAFAGGKLLGRLWKAAAVGVCWTTLAAVDGVPTAESAGRGKANLLAAEKSLYLLQHAYNPVDWFPWGEKAFAKARKEDKPIFLSIGYSTCHWCHVMEKESFSNPEIARIMNKYSFRSRWTARSGRTWTRST